jgi:hypothetical protein
MGAKYAPIFLWIFKPIKEVFMSRVSLIRLGFAAVMAGFPASEAFALVAQQQTQVSAVAAKLLSRKEVVIRPSTVTASSKKFANRFDVRTQFKIDSVSGAVRLITGDLAPALRSSSARDLVDVAINWVASHEDLLMVQPEDLTLVEDATLITDDVQFLRFNVSRAGTPVADAVVNFRFKHGKLVQVLSRTFGEAIEDNRTSFVNATDAIERVASSASIQEQGQVLRVQQISKGYKLVRVNKALASIDGQLLAVQSDAATGDIFEVRDTRHYAEGNAHGSVFPRTYYQSQTLDSAMINMEVLAGATPVKTGLDGKFSFTGTIAPKISTVKGSNINVRTSTGTAVSRTATETSGVWDLNLNVTAEKDQAQVHTYHHLNLMVQKAKKYISSPWMDRVLTANVNLGQTCNAYWNGSSVNFFSAGGGCGNTGLISYVMYHEWGHGLDENTGGIDDGAYSEGFGDILSMIMTNDSRLGPGFRSNGGIVRDMEPDMIYPKDRGEVHAEGLIIGGTFWDLFKTLSAKHGAEKANDLVSAITFKTIFTATNYTDVYDAALVVNDNDSDTSTRAPDFCDINAAFTAHGLATKASDCQ